MARCSDLAAGALSRVVDEMAGQTAAVRQTEDDELCRHLKMAAGELLGDAGAGPKPALMALRP